MALLEQQLVVRKSTLPGAGMGLFTRVPVPKGTRIVEYKGRVTTWKEVKDDDGKNGYIFFISYKRVIDALPYRKAKGRFANDARGIVRRKGVLNNADYVVDGGRCFIEATRAIPAGAEIFVDYGRDYWKVIRENLAIEAEEKKGGTKRGHAAHTAKRTK